MKHAILAAFLFIGASATPTLAQPPGGRLDRLHQLCAMVGTTAREPAQLSTYLYQTVVHEIADVRSGDSLAEKRRKIQAAWPIIGRVKCNDASFAFTNGSLLKLAVTRTFDNFIYDAALEWQIDLNFVDAGDGRTLLDYIADEMRRLGGGPLFNKLEEYYETLREVGARHCRELMAQRPDRYQARPCNAYSVQHGWMRAGTCCAEAGVS